MSRIKPKTIVVQSEASAEAVMLELAGLERNLERIRLDSEENIDLIKKNAREEMEPLQTRKKELEAALCTFATLHRDKLFAKRKSLETPYGPYGFRKSTKLQTLPRVKLQDVLGRLLELNITEAIKVKRSVDKEVMRDWPDSRLETVGMRRVVSDDFYIEIASDSIGD